MSETASSASVFTEQLMVEVRDRVRRRYEREMASEHYAAVRAQFTKARDIARNGRLFAPAWLLDDRDQRLRPYLRFTSHRPVIGPILVFVKRRLLMPVMHWLYEYSRENFRRQQDTNEALLASVEVLALENAFLTERVQNLERQVSARDDTA